MFKTPSKPAPLFKKTIDSTRVFASFSLIFLVALLFLSFVEVGLAFKDHSISGNFIDLLAVSSYQDLRFFLKWLIPAYLIFLPFHMLLPKLCRSLFSILILILVIVELLLIFYFNTTLLMLGSDIFGYSADEIVHIVGASESFTLVPVILFILIVAGVIYALSKFTGKTNRILSFILLICSLIFLVSGISDHSAEMKANNTFEANLVENKSQHFYEAAYSYFNPEIYEVDIYAESYWKDSFTDYSMAAFEYPDEANYPFFHKPQSRDVLSPFFKRSEKSPNIVIIVVEGLGRAFSNEGAYLGNFTPFLDSLSRKSLYWPNFLSNGGRTFAVLPSLLGSLPFAENGFMELQEKMPEHLSLLNILQKNGYRTSFYYGGNSEFDKMKSFLQKNKITNIIDENDFPAGYEKIPSLAGGFTWGYGDKELYRYYMENVSSAESSPKLDILLTISMHNPFLISETERFTEIFEEKLDNFGFDEEKKKRYRNYEKQYTSILFADDALKNLFETYKGKKEFDNTIFVITGDHRIPEIPMATKIDRYHVPLLIYSPLLNRPAKFESVSSHLDVAPSLLSFLENRYDVNRPQNNAFLGHGLDTTRTFQNMHEIPLMQTKTDLIDFVKGEFHLNGNDLYRLKSNMIEEPFEDPEKKEELRYLFNQFKRKNSEIIEGKKLLPDSIIQDYISG